MGLITNRTPHMTELVDKMSSIFQGTQYPEFALGRVDEAIKNSQASREEKAYMSSMARDYVAACVKEREEMNSPEKRRQREVDSRLEKMQDRQAAEKLRQQRAKYIKEHKYD